MVINDQIRDEKLEYDINREAAKISSESSGKLHKYEYLTGEDILPSNQQQIIEQARFTYSFLGKAFEKQIKSIEDQGKKEIDVLKSLKLKEETKPIEDKSNNQSKAEIIFNKLLNEKKDLPKELHDSVDYNKFKFDFMGPAKDVSFYRYRDSKELFSVIKNNQINFDDVLKSQKEFLNKLSRIKIGRKTIEKSETIDNIEKFYKSRKEVINF